MSEQHCKNLVPLLKELAARTQKGTLNESEISASVTLGASAEDDVNSTDSFSENSKKILETKANKFVS